MNQEISKQLSSFIEEGEAIDNEVQLDRWYAKVAAFLQVAGGPNGDAPFSSLIAESPWETLASRIGYLRGIVAKAAVEPAVIEIAQNLMSASKTPFATNSRKVFIVHGHDVAAKESVARFIGKLGLEPIILHEQANSGRTVIEKFETYADDIAFAVVLLTPDDVGAAVGEASELRKRGRQNVILELGYFLGRLSRNRVCALYADEVELPSDYQGVLWVEMDQAGGWRAKLAQELVEAQLPIDLSGLIGS